MFRRLGIFLGSAPSRLIDGWAHNKCDFRLVKKLGIFYEYKVIQSHISIISKTVNIRMHPSHRSRRCFLSSSLLTFGSLSLPSFATSFSSPLPAWLIALEKSVRSHSHTLSASFLASNIYEIRCSLSDPFGFGSSHGNLAGLKVKVKAEGNCLSFQHDGLNVRIILNYGSSSTPLPA